MKYTLCIVATAKFLSDEVANDAELDEEEATK